MFLVIFLRDPFFFWYSNSCFCFLIAIWTYSLGIGCSSHPFPALTNMNWHSSWKLFAGVSFWPDFSYNIFQLIDYLSIPKAFVEFSVDAKRSRIVLSSTICLQWRWMNVLIKQKFVNESERGEVLHYLESCAICIFVQCQIHTLAECIRYGILQRNLYQSPISFSIKISLNIQGTACGKVLR